MSWWMDLLFIVAGVIALAASLFGENFRKTDPETLTADYGPSSKWSGKLVFAIVGISFLSIGFYQLFYR